VDDVINLLKSLKLSNFCQKFEENMIDGPTLMNCKSEDDVKQLGIDLTAKARVLFEEIVQFKSSGVPLTLFSEVTLSLYRHLILFQQCFILNEIT
jgi:hypothetical protein